MAKPVKSATGPSRIKLTGGRGEEATGSANHELQERLVSQALEALWIPTAMSRDDRAKHIESVMAMLQGIKPVDVVEGMLAAQMVATHNAAMECTRRSMLPEQTLEGRDLNLKHAAKLLGIFTRQMDTLNKHRGKGQQHVTVEHVHVEAGAQAIVGNVETTRQPAPAGDQRAD